MRWRLAAGVVLVAVLIGVLAEPAAANHTVVWGAGRECGTVSKTATTTVNTSVSFLVCVTLGGEPLPGHPMHLKVTGPTRTVESDITTGDDGTVHFGVKPTAEGDTHVVLCDADGCVYGETVITATPAPTTTTARAQTPPPPVVVTSSTTVPQEVTTSSTTTSTIDEQSTTTLASSKTSDEKHGGGSFPWWLLALAVVAIVVIAVLVWLRTRGVQLAGGGSPPIAAAPREHGVRPVIFVPGIMATALRIRTSDGPYTHVWPPRGFDGSPRASLESLEVRPNTEFEIDTSTGDGLLDGIHAELINTLNGHGYKNMGDPPNLYIYPYSWMTSCAAAGAGLAQLIRRAIRDHGVPPSIVCHSMGGLVVRAAWHLHGAREIDKVIYIGSPHFGAPMAYFVLHPDIPYAFLGGTEGRILNAAYAMSVVRESASHEKNDVRDLAMLVRLAVEGSTAFDSTLKQVGQNAAGVFELLPDELYFEHINPHFPVGTIIGHPRRDRPDEGDTLMGLPETEAYSPDSWQQLYLRSRLLHLPPHLHPQIEAAMAFKHQISGPLPPEDGSRTMIIYGRTQKTTSSVTFDRNDDGELMVGLSGDQGGDGTVPRESGRGKPIWSGEPRVEVENSVEHFRLTETPYVSSLVREFLPPGGA